MLRKDGKMSADPCVASHMSKTLALSAKSYVDMVGLQFILSYELKNESSPRFKVVLKLGLIGAAC